MLFFEEVPLGSDEGDGDVSIELVRAAKLPTDQQISILLNAFSAQVSVRGWPEGWMLEIAVSPRRLKRP